MSALKTPIVNTTVDNEPTPFPTIGELVRFIARAFDIKNTNKKLDTFAQDFNFNWLTENELVDDGIREPLNNNIGEVFADWVIARIRKLLQSYKNLMLATNADVLKREETLQLLINEFFITEVFSMLEDAEIRFDFPYKQCFVDKDKSVFSIVLKSFSQEQDFLQKVEHTYANNFAPDSNGTDRRINKLEQFRDWLKRKNIPDLSSLKLLARNIANHSLENKTNIMQCLILARSLDWIFAEMNKHNFTLELSQQLSISNYVNVWFSLEQLNFSKTPVTNNIQPVLDSLISKFNSYKTQKLSGDLELFKSELIDSQEIILKEANLNCGQYMIDLFYGRFYVMQGQPEAALKFYESSFKRSLYRAGATQKEILKELLATAAYSEDKTCLKKHKAWGLAFNIYPKNKFSDEKIENWEIKELKNYFFELFPKSCLFLEAGECYQYPTNSVYTLESQQLNLRSPNIKVPFGSNPTHQLNAQVLLGNFESVRKLLECGADVNRIDLESGGGSALLNALQNANQTYSPESIEMVVELLKYPHTKETLNRLTDIKRLSVLFEAIQLGKPDIVETILDMGANPNLRAEIDNHSPLDCCIQQLYILRNKDYWKNLSTQIEKVNPEDLARITRQFAPHMFDNKDISLSNLRNRHHEIFEEVMKYFDKNHRKKHSEASLFGIAQLLLMNGANPNNGNSKNYGVTPLMYAAEVKHKPIFDLLIKYKGDVYQPNSEGRCALDYLRHGVW